MTSCNATIVVGGLTLPCNNHDEPFDHINWTFGIGWTDDAPGATSHQDPAWYRAAVEASGDGWVVHHADHDYRISWFTAEHPDPQGAAESEAARLNGTEHHIDFMGQRAAEARAEAEDHRARANENFDEAMHWRSEADRYRKALGKILPAGVGPGLDRSEMQRLARRVLDGGEA